MNNETRYPDDLELLSYPDDTENFVKKITKTGILPPPMKNAISNRCGKIAYIRKMRNQVYPAMVRQELKAEGLEGIAEYIGLKALKQINAEKYRAIIQEDLEKLKAESSLLFDIRRISYFTGTIYFLCLEQFGLSVKNAFGTEETANEQNRPEIANVTAEIADCSFVLKHYSQLLAEKKAKTEAHIKRSQYIESDAVICGYDPMNMFRMDDTIFCRHFVFLNENGGIKAIHSAVALKLAEGSNRRIAGYYV